MKKSIQKFTAIVAIVLLSCASFYSQKDSNTETELKQDTAKRPRVCMHDQQMEWARKNIPDFEKKMAEQEQQLQQRIKEIQSRNKYGNQTNAGGIYHIPVAVHIISDPNNPVANITYAQVLSQINAMNSDFQNLTTGGNPLTVRFCLARNTPSGVNWSGGINEPGVMKYSNSTVTYTNADGAADHAALANLSSAFNPQNYLNIYVVTCIYQNICLGATGANGGILGYSGYPILAGHPIYGTPDGIVVDYRAFGVQSGSSYNLPYPDHQTGNVMTHELGHYFNLWHTFQGGCGSTNNDYVADTPPDEERFGVCPAPGTYNCSGFPAALTRNYMSYYNGDCLNSFTQGQTLRMDASIGIYRNNLTSSSNITLTGIDQPGGCANSALFSDFKADKTQACTNTNITFNNDPPSNTAVSRTWTFTNLNTGASVSFTNPAATYIYAFPTAGPYTVQLLVTDASGNQKQEVKLSYIYITACGTGITGTQKNWVFGNFASLDFGTGIPNPGQRLMVAHEGGACISNSAGNLLFYSNGIQVWRANNTLMQGMTGPIGTQGVIGVCNNPAFTSSAVQGVLIVPHPGNLSDPLLNQYYIFTVSDIDRNNDNSIAVNRGLRFSIVDMDLNSGTGDFVSIDQPVNGTVRTTEHLAAAPACDGGYWIVTHGADIASDNRLMVYKLNPNGTINSTFVAGNTTSFSVIWEAAYNNDIHDFTLGAWGSIKFSPDNTMMAITAAESGTPNSSHTELYYFDCNNGTVQLINNNLLGQYSCSFSPDSRLLYTQRLNPNYLPPGTTYIQYNLANLSLNNPNPLFFEFGQSIGMVDGFQLGPDNKLYIAQFNQSTLTAINFPNAILTQNGLIPNTVGYNSVGVPLLGTTRSFRTLPNMIDAQKPVPTNPDFTYTAINCTNFSFQGKHCGTSYLWNFGDPSSPNNTSTLRNPTHTFTNQSPFTVTLTIYVNGIPYVTSKVINIGTFAAPVIAAPVSTPCIYSGMRSAYYSVQNPLPGYVYSWSVTGGFPVTKTNATFIDVAWDGQTFPSSITLTMTDPATGCFKTATLQPPVCCTGDYVVPSGGITVSTTTTWQYNKIAVNGNITINSGGNLTINCPNVSMAPNVKITINGGGTLTITNASFLHACSVMWDGIYVNSTGMLTINSNSRIEDAQNAIVSINGGNFLANTAIFNKNYKAVVMQTFPPSGNHPGRIQNCVITCRVLPANPTVAGIKNSLTTYIKATLRIPRQIEKSLLAVQVGAMGAAWVGQPGSTYTNYIDNMVAGVWSTGVTTLRVFNNRFTDILPLPPCTLPPAQCPPVEPCPGDICPPGPTAGAAVDASTGTTFQGGTGSSTFNTFTNCLYGEYVRSYPYVTISYNTFTNIQETAIRVEATTYTAHNINFNNITNAKRGIYNVVNGPTFTVNGAISYNSNTINNNGTYNVNGTPLKTNEGIFAETFGVTGYVNSGFQPQMQNNNITNAATGIYLRNYGSFTTKWTVSTNTVLYNLQPTVLSTGIRVVNSHYAYVTPNNMITGNTSNVLTRGISVENSNNVIVQKNTMNTVGLGINIYGTCNLSSFACNNMNSNNRGINLNAASIPQQGIYCIPSDNKWNNPLTAFADIYEEVLSQNNKWYCRNISAPAPYYWPQTNNPRIFPLNADALAPYCNTSCSFQQDPQLITNNFPKKNGNAAVTFGGSEDDSLKIMLANLTDIVFGPGFTNEHTYYRDRFVYQFLRKRNTLMDKASNEGKKLDAFYKGADKTNQKLFADFQNAIENKNIVLANTVNDGINPVNIIEGNLKSYYNIYLSYLVSGKIMDKAQENTLLEIASQCAVKGGPAVYYARTLLGYVTNTMVDYPDNCKESRIIKRTIVQEEEMGSRSINLYPNPNNGNMQLDYELTEKETGVFFIYDLSGRKVKELPLQTGKNTMQLSESGLENGVYYYSMIIDGKTAKTDKLTIIK